MNEHKRLPVVFYRTATGKEPVRDWLRGLSSYERRVIGEDIQTLEFGWPIGMPSCRSLGKGLWEVRSSLSESQKIARVLFCVEHKKMVLLHGFIKKTQKTPQSEIELALKRMKGMD